MTPARVKEIFKTACEATTDPSTGDPKTACTFHYGKTSDAAIAIIHNSTGVAFAFMDSGGMTVNEDTDNFEMKFTMSFLSQDKLDSAPSEETDGGSGNREEIMTDMYDLWKEVKAYVINNHSDELVLLADDGFFIQHGFHISSGYALRLTVSGRSECL